jgi:hypothetical protein
MAVLPDLDRARVAAQWMRAQIEACAFTKANLRAAVDATDAWIETNQTAFNAALPTAFRNSASLTQKTLVFCYVAMRRAGILRTEEDG